MKTIPSRIKRVAKSTAQFASPELQLVLASVFWGSTFFIMKNVFSYIDPIILVACRFAVASFILFVLLTLSHKKPTQNIRNGIVLGFILFTAFVSQAVGLQFTSSANSGFITGMFIIITPFLRYLLIGKKPKVQTILTTIIASAGLWILTGGITNIRVGDMITLITPVAVGLYNVVVEKYMKPDTDPLVLNFQQFLTLSIFAFATAILTGRSFSVDISTVAPVILYLAIFPAIVSYALQINAQKKVSSTKVGIITTLEPVFASLFAWTLGREVFSTSTATGGTLIVAGMLLSEIPLGQNKRE